MESGKGKSFKGHLLRGQFPWLGRFPPTSCCRTGRKKTFPQWYTDSKQTGSDFNPSLLYSKKQKEEQFIYTYTVNHTVPAGGCTYLSMTFAVSLVLHTNMLVAVLPTKIMIPRSYFLHVPSGLSLRLDALQANSSMWEVVRWEQLPKLPNWLVTAIWDSGHSAQ